jgi:phytol kinase
MLNPWVGMALVLGLLAVATYALWLFQRLAAPHPELVRKLLHVGMGLTAASFRWLFADVWPVLALGVVSLAAMACLRLMKGLKDRLGSVLASVARRSLGEFYFIAGVAVLFLLTRSEPDPIGAVLYCVPLLILALADAVAALIGVRYGKVRYDTVDGQKSAEGSVAFFTVAFFCALLPLLLGTDCDRTKTVLIALIMGFLVMLCEAVAWHGLDNLVIPLVTFLILKIFLGLEVAALAARLVVLALLCAGVYVARRWTTLGGSALLGAVLVGYLSWALEDWLWLLPPLILFTCYTLIFPSPNWKVERHQNVYAVLSVGSAGLIWLFLAKVLNRPDFLLPYSITFAAHLAMIGLARVCIDRPQSRLWIALPVCVAKGCLPLTAPVLALVLQTPQDPWVGARCALWAGVGAAGVAAAVLLFCLTQPELSNCPTDVPRWLRQGCNAAVGSTLGFVALYLM